MMSLMSIRSLSSLVSQQLHLCKVLPPLMRFCSPVCHTHLMPMACLKTTKVDTPEFHGLFTPELKKLVELFSLNHHELRIAGGAVRDLLLGKCPSDLDFATTATPQQMQAMFESEGIRMFNNKGEKHGTVTCRINDKENFEVTTLRVDVETDGRHAQVQFTTDWQLDAERRDLTINSMFLGLDGTLYDYYNGQEDLLERKVRFVGDAASRIQEDYLRILRYFRFHGRISTEPNVHSEETLKAIRQNAAGLHGISGERIWIELKKIMTGQHVSDIIRVMFELGITRYLGLPATCDLAEFDRVWKGCADLSPLPMTLLSALLSTDQQAITLNRRVKMSKDELHLGLFILAHRNDDVGEKIFDFFEDLMFEIQGNQEKAKEKVNELLKYRNLRTTLDALSSWTPPKFPVSGFRLSELGIPKGKQFAKVLGFLRLKWKESRYTLGEKELLEFIDEAKKCI